VMIRTLLNFRSGMTLPFRSGCLVLLMLFLSGCGGNAPEKTASAPSAGAGHDHHHDHPSEGPHHGQLIELGNEEFHAELTHDEEGRLTIYILDSSAKKTVPIEAADVTINVTQNGQASQYKLPASAEMDDPEGKSSRFQIQDRELVEKLDAEGTTAQLVVTIDGKQFIGKIEHNHDHHGHSHGGHQH
jgi:hypothetical protein